MAENGCGEWGRDAVLELKSNSQMLVNEVKRLNVVVSDNIEFDLSGIGVQLKKTEFASFVAPFINILEGNIKKVLVQRGYMLGGETIGWE